MVTGIGDGAETATGAGIGGAGSGFFSGSSGLGVSFFVATGGATFSTTGSGSCTAGAGASSGFGGSLTSFGGFVSGAGFTQLTEGAEVSGALAAVPLGLFDAEEDGLALLFPLLIAGVGRTAVGTSVMVCAGVCLAREEPGLGVEELGAGEARPGSLGSGKELITGDAVAEGGALEPFLLGSTVRLAWQKQSPMQSGGEGPRDLKKAQARSHKGGRALGGSP